MANGKDSKKELFNILGLKEDADKDEIKKAYRKLAKKNHPDINKDDPNANKKFMKIQDAYDELLTQDQDQFSSDLHKPKFSNLKNSFFDSFFSSPFEPFQSSSREKFDTPSQFVNIKDDIRRKKKIDQDVINPFEVFDRRFQEIIKKFFKEFEVV
jgi:molecular chaperone DnaJ